MLLKGLVKGTVKGAWTKEEDIKLREDLKHTKAQSKKLGAALEKEQKALAKAVARRDKLQGQEPVGRAAVRAAVVSGICFLCMFDFFILCT